VCTTNYFFKILSKYYNIELSSKPDILIFGNYGVEHKKYTNCIKMFFSGENKKYLSLDYDYLIDYQFITSKRHYRLPLFVCYDGYHDLLKPRKEITVEDIKHRKFCNFIFSNDSAEERKIFCKRLHEYKHVDCGGKVLNNTGYLVENKRAFIADYKFTIAFENSVAPGYTTEKLFEPLSSRSLPIYWGNPKAPVDFNEHAFLQLDDMSNMDALISKIIEIDTNDALYLQYLNAPVLPSIMPDYAKEEHLIAFFDTILHTRPSRIKRYFATNITKDSIYDHPIIYD